MTYIKHNLRIIPFSFLCLAVLIVLFIYLFSRRVAISFLISYAFLILSVTLLSRRPSTICRVNLVPFWSYKNLLIDGEIREQIIANIALFIPIGFIIPYVINWKKGIAASVLFSALIEFLQLVFHRGLFEIDDVISNTIGILIGFCFFALTKALKRCFKRD